MEGWWCVTEVTTQSKSSHLKVHNCYTPSVIQTVHFCVLLFVTKTCTMFLTIVHTLLKYLVRRECFCIVSVHPEYGDGQLNGPAGITTDRFSNLVVCDCVNKRLQIFSLDGKVLSILEGQHIGLGDPYSVVVSSTGQLFVTDAEKQ